MDNNISKIHPNREDNIKLAEAILKSIFNDEYMPAEGIPIKTVYDICLCKGTTKGFLKEARKNIGIQSENRNGVQYWFMPKQEGKK